MSIARWADQMIVAAIGLSVCLMIRVPLGTAEGQLGELLGGLPLVVQFIALLFATSLLWTTFMRLGGFRLRDVVGSNLLRYPPTWVLGVLSALAYLWLTRSDEQLWALSTMMRIWPDGVIAALVAFPGGWLGAQLMVQLQHTLSCSPGALPSQNSTGVTGGNLRTWIQTEKPIERPKQDRFGFWPRAERLAGMLVARDLRTVGIVGTYGMGKTSFLNLVIYAMEGITVARVNATHGTGDRSGTTARNWCVCRIEAWGRHPDFFAEQILRDAVQVLGERVDALSLATLPAQYTAAMSGTGSAWGSVISAVLSASHDPVDGLRRLNSILAATGQQMLIVVEDLDRNTSDRLIDDVLPALLDRIKELENVSFVLAIGSGRYGAQTLLRLCDRTEYL